MKLGILIEGNPEYLNSRFIEYNDMKYSVRSMRNWSHEERKQVNVYEIKRFTGPVPDGKKLIDRELEFDSSEEIINEVGIFEDFVPNITPETIVKERNRRLAEGFDYDFGDERGVHNIGTTKNDMEGWNEVTMGSNAAISTGQSDTEFTIVTNTGSVTVKAIEWQDILLAATNFRQPIWQASFALQQMDPIPTNYDDDSYWP